MAYRKRYCISPNKNGLTPLHDAAQIGHLEMVKIILEYAIDKNPEDNDGVTPLHDAAQIGHLEIVKIIMEYAINKNKTLIRD
jgi:ankyrin repeat protein